MDDVEGYKAGDVVMVHWPSPVMRTSIYVLDTVHHACSAFNATCVLECFDFDHTRHGGSWHVPRHEESKRYLSFRQLLNYGCSLELLLPKPPETLEERWERVKAEYSAVQSERDKARSVEERRAFARRRFDQALDSLLKEYARVPGE